MSRIHAFRFESVSKQLICHSLDFFQIKSPKNWNQVSNRIAFWIESSVQIESQNRLKSRLKSHFWLWFAHHWQPLSLYQTEHDSSVRSDAEVNSQFTIYLSLQSITAGLIISQRPRTHHQFLTLLHDQRHSRPWTTHHQPHTLTRCTCDELCGDRRTVSPFHAVSFMQYTIYSCSQKTDFAFLTTLPSVATLPPAVARWKAVQKPVVVFTHK